MDAARLGTTPDSAAGNAQCGAELVETVGRLRAALGPAKPSPSFREELRLRLIHAARRERNPIQIAHSAERRTELLVGAAILSVAGALMYVWRSRTAAPRRVPSGRGTRLPAHPPVKLDSAPSPVA